MAIKSDVLWLHCNPSGKFGFKLDVGTVIAVMEHVESLSREHNLYCELQQVTTKMNTEEKELTLGWVISGPDRDVDAFFTALVDQLKGITTIRVSRNAE